MKTKVHLIKHQFIASSLVAMLSMGLSSQVNAVSPSFLPSIVSQSIAFIGADITGTHFGQGLKVLNELGQESSFEDYQGKVVLVFFGYTQCPDICPTALAELADLHSQLSAEEAAQVQVVMVSIDPERDTPETMKAYLSAFHESFKGMTGSQKDIAAMAKSFRAYYKKIPGPADNYAMEHSSSIYALDKAGQSRIIFRPEMKQEDMLKDIRELLAAK